MIRPAAFAFDPETARSNEFQVDAGLEASVLQERAEAEFDAAADMLREKAVNTFVIEDTIYPATPDAIFPNNWISFHENGMVILYPMFASSRRQERRPEIIEGLRSAFEVGEVVDLSGNELHGRFLEGTGSMVLDRVNLIAYASISPRTDKTLFSEVSERLGYNAVSFHSHGRSGRAIYHTNVMMAIGERFAVVCLDAISDAGEREVVARSLRDTGHEIIEISLEQMGNFAANVLALRTTSDDDILALSRRAFQALSREQVSLFERTCEIVPLEIPTIETAGGGSARCMIAEIFLKGKTPVILPRTADGRRPSKSRHPG